MKETKNKLYLDIWGQCTPTLQNLIEADSEYESKKNEQDPIYLLKTIRSIMTEVESNRNRYRIYYEKLSKLFEMKMVSGETINSFLARVRAQFDIIRSISGGGVFQSDFTSANPGLNTVYDKKLEEKFLCMFVMCIDRIRMCSEKGCECLNCQTRMEMIIILRKQANC